jgi:RNA polymerase-binding transcription factor DksA
MINTQHYKELLESELANLEKELATVGQKNPEKKGDWEAVEKMDIDTADEEEVADSMTEYETNNAILDQLETRLNEVKNALKKIEDGTYGICEISGQPIEEDRLEANPAAKTCKTHMND